jgi:hypothetical protein
LSQADIKASAATATAPLAGEVRSAIARAAQATGVDFSYLLAQARLESSLDPQARAATSSAAGLYQFTKGTWSTMLARHGAALGLDGPGAGSRAALMALRYDPSASAMMAAELAGDNTAALTGALGRAPKPSELYLAHFLGPAGAASFLTALAANPNQSAAALLPKAAATNRAVFFEASGAARSLGAVMGVIQSRMDTAMNTVSDPAGSDGVTSWAAAFNPAPTIAAPVAQQFADAQADIGDAGASPGRTSMADVLRNTFAIAGAEAGAGAGAAPDFVRSAYGRMQALGL